MSDGGINLDFGGVDPIIPGEPVPDGVYVLRVDDASVVPTKDKKNQMIECHFVVDCPENHELARYNGRRLMDNWFLPNPATQTPEDMRKTKGYLRGRLEMVTNEDWSRDGMRLHPKELIGYKFKALVAKIDEGYGPQNRIRRYMQLNAETELGFTAPSPPITRRNQPPAGGEQPPGGPRRFQI